MYAQWHASFMKSSLWIIYSLFENDNLCDVNSHQYFFSLLGSTHKRNSKCVIFSFYIKRLPIFQKDCRRQSSMNWHVSSLLCMKESKQCSQVSSSRFNSRSGMIYYKNPFLPNDIVAEIIWVTHMSYICMYIMYVFTT